MEKTLDIAPCQVAEVLPFLAATLTPATDTTGGLATVQDLSANAQAFRIRQDGHDVGAYTVEVYQYDRGACLFVTNLNADVRGLDMTSTMSHVIEAQARRIGAKQIGMITKRRGLAKRLAGLGWEAAGIKMVKKL